MLNRGVLGVVSVEEVVQVAEDVVEEKMALEGMVEY
jgi:hypothetical protein